jgi:hypothetical protein
MEQFIIAIVPDDNYNYVPDGGECRGDRHQHVTSSVPAGRAASAGSRAVTQEPTPGAGGVGAAEPTVRAALAAFRRRDGTDRGGAARTDVPVGPGEHAGGLEGAAPLPRPAAIKFRGGVPIKRARGRLSQHSAVTAQWISGRFGRSESEATIEDRYPPEPGRPGAVPQHHPPPPLR